MKHSTEFEPIVQTPEGLAEGFEPKTEVSGMFVPGEGIFFHASPQSSDLDGYYEPVGSLSDARAFLSDWDHEMGRYGAAINAVDGKLDEVFDIKSLGHFATMRIANHILNNGSEKDFYFCITLIDGCIRMRIGALVYVYRSTGEAGDIPQILKLTMKVKGKRGNLKPLLSDTVGDGTDLDGMAETESIHDNLHVNRQTLSHSFGSKLKSQRRTDINLLRNGPWPDPKAEKLIKLSHQGGHSFTVTRVIGFDYFDLVGGQDKLMWSQNGWQFLSTGKDDFNASLDAFSERFLAETRPVTEWVDGKSLLDVGVRHGHMIVSQLGTNQQFDMVIRTFGSGLRLEVPDSDVLVIPGTKVPAMEKVISTYPLVKGLFTFKGCPPEGWPDFSPARSGSS